MLTREENEILTRVGPGTPAGEFLRRYWFPVAVASELTDENPTQLVRILGETLVLFRDKTGHVGLLTDRCSHRGASLCYGRVEERGIACPYHGWLYDTKGNCLETPAEPWESKFHLTVKQSSYPVQKLVGLYWAYMGPPAGAAVHQLRYLVSKGRLPQDFHSASARLQLVSGHGKFDRPGASCKFSIRTPPVADGRCRIARAA